MTSCVAKLIVLKKKARHRELKINLNIAIARARISECKKSRLFLTKARQWRLSSNTVSSCLSDPQLLRSHLREYWIAQSVYTKLQSPMKYGWLVLFSSINTNFASYWTSLETRIVPNGLNFSNCWSRQFNGFALA